MRGMFFLFSCLLFDDLSFRKQKGLSKKDGLGIYYRIKVEMGYRVRQMRALQFPGDKEQWRATTIPATEAQMEGRVTISWRQRPIS